MHQILHFRLVAGFCCSVNTRPFCAHTEHRIPLLLFPGLFRPGFRGFCKKAGNRVTTPGTGAFFEFAAFFTGRYLGRQQQGEVVLPERGVDLSRFKKTLDMPCCIFHAMMYGKCRDLGIAGKKSRDRMESPDPIISQRVLGIAPQNIDLPQDNSYNHPAGKCFRQVTCTCLPSGCTFRRIDRYFL